MVALDVSYPTNKTGPSAPFPQGPSAPFPQGTGPASPPPGGASRDPGYKPSQEDLREAYNRLRELVSQDPGATANWILLVDTCLRLNRKEEAKAQAIKAIERDPRCREAMVEVMKGQISESEIAKLPQGKLRQPFYQEAASVLTYPFRGNGPALLIGGGVVFTALALLYKVMGVFCWLPILITAGYLASYMMTIIDSSGRGNREPPDYPDFMNFGDSIIGPFWIATCASLFPAVFPLGYIFLCGINLGVIPFVALGLFYWPMALTAGSIFQSCMPVMNPALVIRAIRACGVEYLLGVLVVYGLVLVSWLAQVLADMALPALASHVAIQVLGLYFLMVEMHILGCIYKNHDEEIGWFSSGGSKSPPPPVPVQEPQRQLDRTR